MTEDQQDTGLADGRDNVMERALGAFDSLNVDELYNDALAFIIDTTGNIASAGGEILRRLGNLPAGDIAADAGDTAASWGKTATDMAAGMATGISAALAGGLDALTRLATGLFGG